jgi:hypothetical protein
MKKYIILLLSLGLLSFSVHGDVRIGNKKVVRSVKKILNAGKIDVDRTCLDEYVARNRQLWKKMGLGPITTFGGIAGTGIAVGTGVGAAMGTGGAAASSSVTLGALIGGAAGGWIGLGIGGVAFIAYEGTQIARFVKNNQIIRLISNSRDKIYESDNIKKFMKKYLKKHPKDKKFLDEKKFGHLVVELDESGALCDGSLVKARGFRKLIKKKKKVPSKLADFLANRKEIITHIHGIVEKSK